MNPQVQESKGEVGDWETEKRLFLNVCHHRNSLMKAPSHNSPARDVGVPGSMGGEKKSDSLKFPFLLSLEIAFH